MDFELYRGDCLELMKSLPDKSVDIVLMDPPYVGMVSESWDNLTDKDADYLFEETLNQVFRILRYGGRLVSFASNNTLRWLYKSKLKHRELLVIYKELSTVAAGRNTRTYKQHVNHTEYCFVATKYARDFVKEQLLSVAEGLSAKQINAMLGVATNGGGMWSIYTGNNKCEQVPTEKQWGKFKNAFPSLPDFSEFEEVFNNGLAKGNVLKRYNFRFIGRVHPTQKPTDLCEYLIESYTKPGHTVLDPFMGSGTTGVACANTGRKFIGIEKDDNYFTIAENRIKEAYDLRAILQG